MSSEVNTKLKTAEYHYSKIDHTWKKNEDNSHKRDFLHHDEHIIDTDLMQECRPVSYFELYKFSDSRDKLMIFMAIFSAIVSGVTAAVYLIGYGFVMGHLVDYVYVRASSTDPNLLANNEQNFSEFMVRFLVFSLATGAAIWVSTYLAIYLISHSALKQSARIRKAYLSRVLTQDMPWHDVNQTGDFVSQNAEDVQKIQDGLGEVTAMFVMNETQAIVCLIQGLILAWDMTLVMFVPCALSHVLVYFGTKVAVKISAKESAAVGEAAKVADEALSSLKTVFAFNGQEEEVRRYEENLEDARRYGAKRLLIMGIANGLSQSCKYLCFALGLWYGIRAVLRERTEPGTGYAPEIMTAVYTSVVTSMEYILSMSAFVETAGMARGCASKIFGIIEAQPKMYKSLRKLKDVEKIRGGDVRFENVYFSYPSRHQVEVLKGLHLTLKRGERVALVGASGCGKSTCMQLLQRLYDPLEGVIYVGDTDIREFDIDFFRKQIGLVGQEPVLFENTIAENIRFGFLEASQAEVEEAARKANAHDFILQFPEGYQTRIGEGGAQLSGGQKQRIAIARALVRKPAILLLDEATSALDTESEALVQAALDAFFVNKTCTVLVIAHRLSTIRGADKIAVIQDGRVIEEGSYNELMSFDSVFKTRLSVFDKGGSLPENMPIISEHMSIISGDMSTISENIPTVPQDVSIFPKDMSTTSEHMSTISEESDDGSSFSPQKEEQQFVSLSIEEKSSLKEDDTESQEDYKEEKKTRINVWTIVRLNFLTDRTYIVFGTVFAALVGASVPLQCALFGLALSVMAETSDVASARTVTYVLYYLSFTMIMGACTFFHTYFLGAAGENFVKLVKGLMFRAVLRQEPGWFDRSENSSGSLGERLSSQPAAVQGALGQRVGLVVYSASTILVTMIVGLILQWKYMLVTTCMLPLILIPTYFENRMLIKESKAYRQAQQVMSQLAVEAIANVRTVTSLGLAPYVQEKFGDELVKFHKVATKTLHFRGLVYGLAKSHYCFVCLVSFFYGIKLIQDEETECYVILMLCDFVLFLGWTLSVAFAFSPNFKKGLLALDDVVRLINRQPKIKNGSTLDTQALTGDVEYMKVDFAYPLRPEVTVLNGFNLLAQRGKTIALVGSSGCGKSTVVQLLMRFYDVDSGNISFGNRNVVDVTLSALRARMGSVFQEPELFSRTIAENIAYGGGGGRKVSRQEIIEAAKSANIHSFVSSLPLGYDTCLGERGSQLSGGQKQRVAIARALVRDPDVLLLDEATSALDTESEEIVLDALDKAKKGRTCLVVAHRLKTIKDADVIVVVRHGRVVEMGRHSSLLSQKGFYWRLYEAQQSLL